MNVNVTERLTFFGRIYGLDTNPQMGMWYLFITIYLLCTCICPRICQKDKTMAERSDIHRHVRRLYHADVLWSIPAGGRKSGRCGSRPRTIPFQTSSGEESGKHQTLQKMIHRIPEHPVRRVLLFLVKKSSRNGC